MARPASAPGRFAAAPRPQSLLFACSENAVRSPMAEALGRALFGGSLYVSSVGVRAGEADPFVTAVMAEVGLDLSHHRPRRFEDLDDACFDAIVSLSPEAHRRALDYTRTLAIPVVQWPTADPTLQEGSRSVRLDAYRGVRDALQARIRREFEGPGAGPRG